MKKVALTSLCITFALAACGDDAGSKPESSPEDVKLADDVVAKAKECKLYTAPANPVSDTVRDDFDRCSGACLLKATCDEIKFLACSDRTDQEALTLCIRKCSTRPEDGFACDDGTTLAHLFVCDGSQDCYNAEDERDCQGFTCANGQMTSHDEAKCDGSEDCPDGSDELDCPDLCR